VKKRGGGVVVVATARVPAQGGDEIFSGHFSIPWSKKKNGQNKHKNGPKYIIVMQYQLTVHVQQMHQTFALQQRHGPQRKHFARRRCGHPFLLSVHR
jgi:hypothetical protein